MLDYLAAAEKLLRSHTAEQWEHAVLWEMHVLFFIYSNSIDLLDVSTRGDPHRSVT